MPLVQNPSLGGGQVPTLQTVTQLTAGQIATLSTLPVQVVPAPGAGKLIVPFGVAYVFDVGGQAFHTAVGGLDTLDVLYSPSLDPLDASVVSMVTAAYSAFGYSAAVPGQYAILPGDDNSALVVKALSDYNAGPIETATITAGGLGYASNDTGTITTGSGDATYRVLSVGAGGAVSHLVVVNRGTAYTTGAGQATATGGTQPGVGVGLTVNITAVQLGNGTLKVITYYQIIPVP